MTSLFHRDAGLESSRNLIFIFILMPVHTYHCNNVSHGQNNNQPLLFPPPPLYQCPPAPAKAKLCHATEQSRKGGKKGDDIARAWNQWWRLREWFHFLNFPLCILVLNWRIKIRILATFKTAHRSWTSPSSSQLRSPSRDTEKRGRNSKAAALINNLWAMPCHDLLQASSDDTGKWFHLIKSIMEITPKPYETCALNQPTPALFDGDCISFCRMDGRPTPTLAPPCLPPSLNQCDH